ncbi:MAG: hypothetical protein MI919_42245 [Holophagales bacterium]|nr:hypothetical protein [Holophagales bacterium]
MLWLASGLAGLLSLLAPTLAGAQLQPELEATVPMVVSGTPLQVKVEGHLPARGRERVVIVQLDGTTIGERKVKRGDNLLVFQDVRPSAGTHRIQLISGTLRAETEFHLLPGWLSVLPPILAIALALVFRDVLIALFLGVFGGAFILAGWNPFAAFANTIDTFIVGSLVDSDHISIIVFTCCLGGMVGLVTKSGGTHGIVRMLAPYATSRRRGQLSTWAMGLTIFFDDYANTLIVGPTMRPITDRLRISREKLAYLVDSTAAPVVCLFPISTWVGFEIGLIGSAFESLGLEADAYTTFVASIPYRFYPLFALLMVFMIALSGVDFGPMRAAERRARKRGLLLAEGAKPIADYSSSEVEPPEEAPKLASNALVPIATVMVMTVLGLWITGVQGAASSGLERGDLPFGEWLRVLLAEADSYKALLWASLTGMTVAFALAVGRRILKVAEAAAALVAGMKAMFLALLVLTLAWSLAAVCQELDTAQFLVGIAQKGLPAALLPALTFVLAAAVAFATGSSWGTMGILTPLVIPIAHQLLTGSGIGPGDSVYSGVLLGTIASVLSGSVWGDHCSPISDTTILSSMASGCDHIAHVRTQLPYALLVAGVAVSIGSIPSALGLNPWISILVGGALLVAGVLVLKRRQGPLDSEPSDGGDHPADRTAEGAPKDAAGAGPAVADA